MSRINEVLNYQSKYTDNNEVLKNKLGVTDNETLNEKERFITSYKLADLYLKGITGNFDVNHYLSIHKYLFDEIYPFAGEIRSENIQKDIPFCLPNLIYENLVRTLEQAKKNLKKITNEEELIKFLADFYAELDIIHPFREGNGRTEREFLRQYMIMLNEVIDFGEYVLDYSKIDDKNNFIKAVIIADATCDTTMLENYIKMILTKKEKIRK